ncbi:hypothetical protein MRB53_002113 [Persea americana]|uniref:Uncharacterized protein n=1 Tax=Persea americana TaxID=3435 RepID=A0ACC2MTM5_PERAE|nr:hypothetical protein MRB53_002113 [Persea americana]
MATCPGGRGHAPDGRRAHDTPPPHPESRRGKGCMPNPATTRFGGRECAPMATCPEGRGHAPDGRKAHETPLIRNSAEVKAACLTLRQPGSEAKIARLQQPALEAEAMCLIEVRPTRRPLIRNPTEVRAACLTLW